MKHYPCVLTIAGSDCSGGAGIQADIKTISALGAYAASAITAITVQNTCGVTGIHPVPPSYVKGQIEAVMTICTLVRLSIDRCTASTSEHHDVQLVRLASIDVQLRR